MVDGNTTRHKDRNKYKGKDMDMDISEVETKSSDSKEVPIAFKQGAIVTETEHSTSITEEESTDIAAIERTRSDWAAWNNMAPSKRTQIENYRNDKALIINIHATHHAGTAVCHRIGRHGIHGAIAPSFVCLKDKDEAMPNRCKTTNSSMNFDSNATLTSSDDDAPYCGSYQHIFHGSHMPLTKEETGPFVEAIRPYFHMISWEYNSVNGSKAFAVARNGRSLDDPDWDHPNLVSILVTRDPISRLLARDGSNKQHYPNWGTENMTWSDWWDYAEYSHKMATNNFFLRILTGTPMPERPSPLPWGTAEDVQAQESSRTITNPNELLQIFPTGIHETHFEHAKSLLHKFTFVLDIACLTEGMEAVGRLLRLELPSEKDNFRQNRKKHSHPPSRERIGHDDIYEYLRKKNEWDIALYEYSKTISLLRCEDL